MAVSDLMEVSAVSDTAAKSASAVSAHSVVVSASQDSVDSEAKLFSHNKVPQLVMPSALAHTHKANRAAKSAVSAVLHSADSAVSVVLVIQGSVKSTPKDSSQLSATVDSVEVSDLSEAKSELQVVITIMAVKESIMVINITVSITAIITAITPDQDPSPAHTLDQDLLLDPSDPNTAVTQELAHSEANTAVTQELAHSEANTEVSQHSAHNPVPEVNITAIITVDTITVVIITAAKQPPQDSVHPNSVSVVSVASEPLAHITVVSAVSAVSAHSAAAMLELSAVSAHSEAAMPVDDPSLLEPATAVSHPSEVVAVSTVATAVSAEPHSSSKRAILPNIGPSSAHLKNIHYAWHKQLKYL